MTLLSILSSFATCFGITYDVQNQLDDNGGNNNKQKKSLEKSLAQLESFFHSKNMKQFRN